MAKKEEPVDDPKAEDFEHKPDISIGAILSEMLPKNPYTAEQTAIMIAGFLMIYLFWIWFPAVLFFGLIIAIWNLGQLCLKSLYKGIAWIGKLGEEG